MISRQRGIDVYRLEDAAKSVTAVAVTTGGFGDRQPIEL
jgi:hypothetical protein